MAAAGRMRSRSASTLHCTGALHAAAYNYIVRPSSTHPVHIPASICPDQDSRQNIQHSHGSSFECEMEIISSISNHSHTDTFITYLSHMIHESWILTSLKPEWWTGARFSCFSTESWACLFRHFSHLSWYRYPAAGRGAGGGPGGPQHRQNCKWDEIVGIWSKYSENRGGTPREIADKMLVVP